MDTNPIGIKLLLPYTMVTYKNMLLVEVDNLDALLEKLGLAVIPFDLYCIISTYSVTL